MNLEKYVIPEVSCDDDWFFLTGQTPTLDKENDWNRSNPRTSTVNITPIKSNQLLVTSNKNIRDIFIDMIR